jgi:hypothetical protein
VSDPSAASVAQDAVAKVTAGIEAAAEAIGKVAPHAWDVLVRQQRAEGVAMLICGISGLLLCGWLHRRNLMATYKMDPGDIWPVEVQRVAIGLLIMIVNICPLYLTATGALRIYNPEYYAAVAVLDKAR